MVFAFTNILFISDNEGGICFRPHARARLYVCLSVCKITQKRVHGFGLNVARRQTSEELINL